MAIGRTRSEVRPEIFDAKSNRSQLCSKIKVRPNRIGLELRYVGPDRSGPLDPPDIYPRQLLLQEKCYGRSGVQHPIKHVPVTFQLLLRGIVDTSTRCESLR
jgi:hypothetical protein